MCQKSGKTCCGGCAKKASPKKFEMDDQSLETQEQLEKRGHSFCRVSVIAGGDHRSILVPVTQLLVK